MLASLSKSYAPPTYFLSILPYSLWQLGQGQRACCWEEPEGSSQRVAGGKEVHLPALKGSLPWGALLRVLAALTIMHAIGCFAAWFAAGKP